MKVGDRVKQLFTLAERHGTIVGIYEEDLVVNTPDGPVLFAEKGELKIQFDHSNKGSIVTLNPKELEIL